MGGLTVNTFLGLNPALAEKISGVIYSAPFFGMHENAGMNLGKKIMTSCLAGVLDEFIVCAPLAIHKVCRNR